MQELKFEKKVSKGSKFNQIYVPKELESAIQAGDLVEVRLISKASNLYFHNIDEFEKQSKLSNSSKIGLNKKDKISGYSNQSIKELSEFKRKLISELIKTIQNYSQENGCLVKQMFFIGSFLTEKVNYNDIDILIITDAKQKIGVIQSSLEEELTEKFNLKFHILAIKEETLTKLLQICPLTISMFNRFVSNKEFKLEHIRKIDKAHIQSLLMMPQDLLEIDLNSKVFFDNLRRLTAIEKFLENKELDAEKINQELKKLLGERVFKIIKNNELIDDELRKVLRKHIEHKLNRIQKVLK